MSFENNGVEVSEKLIKFTEAHQEVERTRNELGQLLGGLIGCRINVRGYPDTVTYQRLLDSKTQLPKYVSVPVYPATIFSEDKKKQARTCEGQILSAGVNGLIVSIESSNEVPEEMKPHSFHFRLLQILEISEASPKEMTS